MARFNYFRSLLRFGRFGFFEKLEATHTDTHTHILKERGFVHVILSPLIGFDNFERVVQKLRLNIKIHNLILFRQQIKIQ